MIIKHMQAGDVSSTTVDFGDRQPSDEEVRRVREILGINVRDEPNCVGRNARYVKPSAGHTPAAEE